MKVSKMVKQAMANAKLQNPKNYRCVHRAWVSAIHSYEYAKKNQGKKTQEVAVEE